jgi:hypothetical protein
MGLDRLFKLHSALQLVVHDVSHTESLKQAPEQRDASDVSSSSSKKVCERRKESKSILPGVDRERERETIIKCASSIRNSRAYNSGKS